jgi:ring-1,2-phenylacetyl-CoA epoxidase subunit PaaE
MSLHFHSLTVKEITKETEDCVSISFQISSELQDQFTYTQGQSIAIKHTIQGQDIRRNYSICSSPLEKDFRIAVKKIEGGLFSTYANEQLKAGEVLQVMSPAGKFYTALHSANQKKYLAIAAGSGITPIISIIKTTLATEPTSEFTLIYGNKNRNSIIFFEELESLKNKYITRFNLIYVLSRERTDDELHYGRINEEKLEAIKKLVNYKKQDELFICGPQELTLNSVAYFTKLGIDKNKIHKELFTASNTAKKEAINVSKSKELCRIAIKSDGREFIVESDLQENHSILDIALKQGADLPFACKGGMCCTCKAKLLEGKVEMDVSWGLEEDEIANGFILTCQSHPKTPNIIIDFDVK